MDNEILKGAKFGDKFLTRSGEIVIYVAGNIENDTYKCIFEPTSVSSICSDLCYFSDGKHNYDKSEDVLDIISKYQEKNEESLPQDYYWNDLKNKTISFPPKSATILVANENVDWYNPNKFSLINVERLLEVCDTPYCQWTHWMKIPPINKNIDEDKLDEIAKDYMFKTYGNDLNCLSQCSQSTIDKFDSYKAGYRKAKRSNYE